jgi:hypothetical protein
VRLDHLLSKEHSVIGDMGKPASVELVHGVLFAGVRPAQHSSLVDVDYLVRR